MGDTKADTICAIEGAVEVESTKSKGSPKKKTLKAGQCAAKFSKGQTKVLPSTKKQWKEIRSLVKSITIADDVKGRGKGKGSRKK
ncbi:MAG: hypothetical protein R3C68_09285 [Myxococcota bacterium]